VLDKRRRMGVIKSSGCCPEIDMWTTKRVRLSTPPYMQRVKQLANAVARDTPLPRNAHSLSSALSGSSRWLAMR
jgi:predicted metal-binding transcription factor (methanogenesis marker protein 9)